MNVLFINACVREQSRTKILADKYLKEISGNITEVNLEKENVKPLNRETLEYRERLILNGEYNDCIFNYARQFAQADEIVIASPFWDLSFPAILKIYFENVTVSGITFKYNNGKPIGLCKAKKLTYITTSGGPIFQDFGYSYVKTLATCFYGIKKTVSYSAQNLDVNAIQGVAVLNQPITEIE